MNEMNEMKDEREVQYLYGEKERTENYKNKYGRPENL
jgi:hypothetical protein